MLIAWFCGQAFGIPLWYVMIKYGRRSSDPEPDDLPDEDRLMRLTYDPQKDC